MCAACHHAAQLFVLAPVTKLLACAPDESAGGINTAAGVDGWLRPDQNRRPKAVSVLQPQTSNACNVLRAGLRLRSGGGAIILSAPAFCSVACVAVGGPSSSCLVSDVVTTPVGGGFSAATGSLVESSFCVHAEKLATGYWWICSTSELQALLPDSHRVDPSSQLLVVIHRHFITQCSLGRGRFVATAEGEHPSERAPLARSRWRVRGLAIGGLLLRRVLLVIISRHFSEL